MSLHLVRGQFIPGFEEQLVGKNIGEETDVNVTFLKNIMRRSWLASPLYLK